MFLFMPSIRKEFFFFLSNFWRISSKKKHLEKNNEIVMNSPVDVHYMPKIPCSRKSINPNLYHIYVYTITYEIIRLTNFFFLLIHNTLSPHSNPSRKKKKNLLA